MRGAVLQGLAWMFVVVTICMGAKIHNKQGCYKSDVMLNCPHYKQDKIGKLLWRFKDKVAGKWTDLASIKQGKRIVFPHNSTLDERVTIHANGSLTITSLHPDDETMYQCKAYVVGLGLHVNVADLKVSCGKVTLVRREVCADDDVMLECDAWHRTNPRKRNKVEWHKKSTSGNDTSWSLLVAPRGSNVTAGDGFKLHSNGSLFLPGGRDTKKLLLLKCDVTKNIESLMDRHIVVLKNIICRREKRETSDSSVKTAAGRVAMTMPINVTMETNTPSVSSVAFSSVHGANHVFLVYVITIWLLMKLG